MKLYHVSLDLTKNTRHFTPRIPKGTTYDEDTSVPRVCFSASLEGALSSCAHIIIKLFNYSLTDNIMVFEVNTDDIVGKIVTPEEAYYCYNVFRCFIHSRVLVNRTTYFKREIVPYR